jgi:mono/diheme cytochrome c family protein
MRPVSRVILTALVTILVVLAVEFCVALAVMWWGVVNVGADHPHPQPVRWYLARAMTYSVQRHAQGLQAPPAAQVSLAEGAGHYGRMCVFCHGAPGVERSEAGQGLSPDPPELVRTAKDWTVEQVYWLVTHGVGDTGMPAFGRTHTEPQRWALASFVKQLPALTPAEYQKLVAASGPEQRE